jgi:hypothetical protein
MTRLFVVVVLIGVATSGIVVVALPPISRRGGVRRAARSGARWTGLANFDAAACHDQAPIIVAAMAGVGRLYGQRFSHRRDQRLRREGRRRIVTLVSGRRTAPGQALCSALPLRATSVVEPAASNHHQAPMPTW